MGKEKIEELAIDMHKKKTEMQLWHTTSQQCQQGTWSAENEATYQVARAEYYKSKNLLDAAITEYSTKGSDNE